jgi:hypothetical protein
MHQVAFEAAAAGVVGVVRGTSRSLSGLRTRQVATFLTVWSIICAVFSNCFGIWTLWRISMDFTPGVP